MSQRTVLPLRLCQRMGQRPLQLFSCSVLQIAGIFLSFCKELSKHYFHTPLPTKDCALCGPDQHKRGSYPPHTTADCYKPNTSWMLEIKRKFCTVTVCAESQIREVPVPGGWCCLRAMTQGLESCFVLLEGSAERKTTTEQPSNVGAMKSCSLQLLFTIKVK